MNEQYAPKSVFARPRLLKYIGNDGRKHVQCPYCKRDWLTGRPGGGMVQAGAERHAEACYKKHKEQGYFEPEEAEQ